MVIGGRAAAQANRLGVKAAPVMDVGLEVLGVYGARNSFHCRHSPRL